MPAKNNESKVYVCALCKTKCSKATFYRSHNTGHCVSKKQKLAPVSNKKSMTLEPLEQPSFNDESHNNYDMESQAKTIDSDCENEQIPIEDPDQEYSTNEETQVNQDVQESNDLEHDEIWETEELPDYFNKDNEINCSEVNSNVRTIVKSLLKWQSKYSLSDSCILSLFRLLKRLLYTINVVIRSKVLTVIVDNIPDSLHLARKIIDLERDEFEQYVVCPKCYFIYPKEDSIITDVLGRKTAKTCDYVLFRKHPQLRFRSPCGAALLKTILNINGDKSTFYPKKIYCYRGIKRGMQDLTKRKDFIEMLFRDVHQNDDYLSDIYDGNMYKTFQDSEGNLYFNDKRNIGLMLNFDFFDPFKRSKYSLGVLYAVIVNLPRESRFLWENVLVIAVVPGPEEPKLSINSFLEPLVDELIDGWYSGMKIEESDGLCSLYKFAIVCISSDLPALRKIGGFLSFRAKLGCSKCFTIFSWEQKANEKKGKPATERDLGHFESDEWTSRKGDEHKKLGFKIAKSNTLEETKTEESKHGVRYSELFRLPYFDPIKMHVVDPMHNLFLGIAHHVFDTWVETGTIQPKIHFEQINQRQERIRVPSDMGRISTSVCSHYKNMKADEWKHWALIYSTYCLRGIIPDTDMRIWTKFVNACHMICVPIVRLSEVKEAHELLQEFAKEFEARYSSKFTVPNMHMMLHLKEGIEDFGPLYAFWCFGFERYNGILGSFQTNGHSIPLQIMRKFVTFSKMSCDDDVDDVFVDGKENHDKTSKLDYKHALSILYTPKIDSSCFESNIEVLRSKASQVKLDNEVVSEICQMFNEYCGIGITKISILAKSASRISIGKQVFAVNRYRGDSPYSYVLARWREKTKSGDIAFRPAVIKNFYQVLAWEDSRDQKFWIAEVCWFEEYEKKKKNYYGENAKTTIWKTTYEKNNCYVPVRFIKNRFVYLKENIKFGKEPANVTVCIELPFNSFL